MIWINSCLIVWRRCSDVTTIPDFTYYFGEYNVIIRDLNDGQNSENKIFYTEMIL